MKKLLFLFLLFGICTPCFAQWTTSGTVTYTTNTVGINTTIPVSSLSVNPSITSPGGMSATALILGSGSTTLPNTAGAYLYPFELNHIYASGHSGRLQFATYRRFVAASGSEWQGAAYRLQYEFDNTGATGQNAYLEIGESDPTYPGNGFISLGTNGVDRLTIGAIGNIGVGTTNPSTYSGYSGLSTNNAVNGGYIDFSQAGALKGLIFGDGNGLTLYSPVGSPLHLYSNAVENMTVLSNGNVGIGYTAPLVKLHVNGALITGALNGDLDPASGGGNITFLGSSSGRMLIGWNRSGVEGESDFIANRGSASTAGAGGFAFYDYSNATSGNPQTELMRIRSTGQVLIGVSNFTASQAVGGMLAVGGGIETDAVTVKTQANWPDYVFTSEYHLPELSTIKSYIEQNHHLPEMPSSADIDKNGQNLGDMNRLLLKKVEELTLYLIEKDRQLQDEKNLVQTDQKGTSEQLSQLKTLIAAQAEQLKIMQLKLAAITGNNK